jgi:hypothetical protein
MKKYITTTLLGALAVACFGLPAVAQPQQQQSQQPPPADPNDPFYRKPKPVPVPVEKDANKPVPIPFPPLEQRQQDYLRAKNDARARGLPDPDPIGQYLVSELAVTGVFQTDSGIGAFVQAIPTNTTFFVGPGTRVYNGEIVSINTGQNFDLGQVVFKELTKYRVKTKEQDVVNTVTKNIAESTAKKP